MAQPLPLTDLFHDGLSPWEKCAEMAAKHPDRAVFWGSVNPLEGKRPRSRNTRQVEDHGAKAFKFYNVRYDYGQPFLAHGRPPGPRSRSSSTPRSSA